jgi:choline kinase
MKAKVDTVVICAAGLGSRLGLDMPKCLVKVGNHPLIYYLLKVLEDVKNIRIVVGFKEEDVIACVKAIRSDVVFIRNKNYMSTTNSYSLFLGSRDLPGPFVNIDGDMYLTQQNFDLFCSKINENEDLIAVTKSYTEDAVFVKLNDNQQVIEFSREKISDLEWTGIAYFSNVKISENGKYVYQEIEQFLPIQAAEIECFEIDTPRDLEVLANKIEFV